MRCFSIIIITIIIIILIVAQKDEGRSDFLDYIITYNFYGGRIL